MDSAPASVVVYHTGPAWVQGASLIQQEHAFGHIRFMRRMVASGAAVYAGPFCALDQSPADNLVGMIVLRSSPARSVELLNEDPAVAHGLLDPKVHPFYPFETPDPPVG